MQIQDNSSSFFAADKKVTFLLLCVATVLVLYIKKSFVENETAAFEFLEDRPEGGILQIITAVQFFSIPLVYLWKFTVIGFVVWVGCFLYGYRITFGQCFGIVIVSEYIFLLPECLKILYFLFIRTDPNLYDIKAYYPLSLMNFFDYYTIDKRYVYPLKALNVFEAIYWALLVSGVDFYARKSKKVAWFIVMSTYGLIFFLWLTFYCLVYQ
jgi:hypothetical protein